MPVATINPDETHERDLETIEGGKIILRKMSYDAFLQRRDMVTRIKLAGKRGQDTQGELDMQNAKVAAYEMKECIVDHNLTDANENKLDFSKSSTLKQLDPRVGQEIGELIDELNQFTQEEELGN